MSGTHSDVAGRQPSRRGWMAVAAAVVGLGLASACGGSSPLASPVTPVQSPSPDPATKAYIALIRSYWADYTEVRGKFGTVCYQGPIVPQQCAERAQAILNVDDYFMASLDTATPPPQFATDNKTLLDQLPKVISAVKGIIAATATRNKDLVSLATLSYVDTMIPTVTDALDRIDPGVVHT